MEQRNAIDFQHSNFGEQAWGQKDTLGALGTGAFSLTLLVQSTH